MPLSELYRMAKQKLDSSQEKNPTCSTDLSFAPENDFVELVWENGQILMQGQSSRTRKSPTSNSLPSHCLPSFIPKSRDKDIGNGTNTKMGKFGAMDSVVNEIPMSVPSGETALSPDDDMVPWLNYSVDESLPNEYCADLLPELSGVTVNELSTQNNFASFYKRSGGNQSVRDSHTLSVHNGVRLEQGNVPKVSLAAGGEATRPRGSPTQLYPSSFQQCQPSFPAFRSRVSNNIGDSTSNSTHHAVGGDSIRVSPSLGGFPSIRTQKQDPVPPRNNPGLMNFSYFSRPVALARGNLQNIGAMSGSGLSSIEKTGSKDKGPAASSSNPAEYPLIDSSSVLQKETGSRFQAIMAQAKVDAKPSEAKPLQEPLPVEPPKGICHDDASKNDKGPCQVICESASNGLLDGSKAIEPVVASSSVCSGNSVERASDDPTHNMKRKHHDTEDSECPSEDVEEESVGVKKAGPARGGTSSKRSRAAEVHNLSERRRRDRINEKMRALQELIPNCNKVDKASMLDEAIEYLKTLQLQVQIMSMGAGLYMPPMMLPTGMQHMHAAHLAHYSPMGVGMGFGMGVLDMNGGSSGCPMIQVPPMHGAHFPGPPMSGPSGLHGMAGSNLQLFGHPSQGLPMSMPRAPLIPLSGGPVMKSMGPNACGMAGPMDNLESAPASSSKDPLKSINSQVMQNTGANTSLNQTSGQHQATNESFEQPVLVQDDGQTSEVTGSGAIKSANGNNNVPDRAAGYE